MMKKIILLVDDDSICNSINKIVLNKKLASTRDLEGTEIFTFTSPLDGLQYLTNSLAENNCERIILLLDINMPIMTGWEFLEEYVLIPKGKTEVLFLS